MGFVSFTSAAFLALAGLVLTLGSAPRPAAAGSPGGQAPADRIAELAGETQALRDESQQVSGTRNLREGKRFAETRVAELLVRRDELDAAIERMGGSAKDLEAYRKEVGDKSVITGGDVAGEAGEKAAEAAARKGLSMGAGRLLGVLGLALDAVEYGGKWVIKQGDLGALDEAVAQNRVNLHDMYQVSIALSGQINAAYADVARMKQIIKRDDEIFPELALLRERQRLAGTRATKSAVTKRETDAAGDAEEQRKHSKDAARRGVQVVPQIPQVAPQVPAHRPSGQRY